MNDAANQPEITSPQGEPCHQTTTLAWTAGVRFVLLMLASVGFVPSCTSQESDSKTAPSVTRTASDEFLSVTMTVSPEAVELGNMARLSLNIEADSGVTLLGHELESALVEGDRKFEYRVHPISNQEAKPISDGRLLWTYTYDLEFFLTNDFELPAVEVSYLVPSNDDDSASERVLATEPLSVSVRLPAGTTLSEAEIREIRRLDPVELPTHSAFSWWFVGLAVAIVLIAAWLWLRRKKRIHSMPAVIIPAHVWAQERLAKLAAEDLVARAQYREFYYRISDIVRGYIERRFSLSAPEMTTDEFLLAAARDPRLLGTITTELDRFMNACDMVKYARHEPAAAEATDVFHSAGEFVERTQFRPTDSDDQHGQSSAGERAA